MFWTRLLQVTFALIWFTAKGCRSAGFGGVTSTACVCPAVVGASFLLAVAVTLQ